MTHQREMILEELSKFKDHPTADALYDRLKKKLPRISLATVYRNLEILSDAGLIRKVDISGRQKRFDLEIEQHSHICCVRCRRVDNIKFDQNQLLPSDPDKRRGYTISGFRIEFFGICPECQQKIGSSEHSESEEAEREEAVPVLVGHSPTPFSARLSERRRKILQILKESEDFRTCKEIADAISFAPEQISRHLSDLKKRGLVSCPVPRKYQLTEAGKDILSNKKGEETQSSSMVELKRFQS